MRLGMSKKGIKISLIIIGLSHIFACSGPNNSSERSNEYLKKKFNSYKEVFIILNDSIHTYIDSTLATFSAEYSYGWIVDSMICINTANDKLFAITTEIPGKGKIFKSDDAMELLGKKINGKWYFFKGGGALTIPRDMYGYSETNPPTQYFLSQIARKNMLESALVKKDGEYVVSDEWIDNKFYQNGYGVYDTHAEYDSIHWMLIMRKWKEKIDTNEYKPQKKNKPNA